MYVVWTTRVSGVQLSGFEVSPFFFNFSARAMQEINFEARLKILLCTNAELFSEK